MCLHLVSTGSLLFSSSVDGVTIFDVLRLMLPACSNSITYPKGEKELCRSLLIFVRLKCFCAAIKS